MLIFTMNNWMRFAISTIYSYARKNYKDVEFYDMSVDTKITNTEIGLLSGMPIFSIPFAIGLIVSGPLSDRYNRSKLIACACIMWSLMHVLASTGNSFLTETF